MKKNLFIAAILICLIFTASSFAEDAMPVQLGFINPVQIFSRSTDITGLKLNVLQSASNTVKGLDLGFCSSVDGDFKGIQYNLFANLTRGNAVGFQSAIYSTASQFTGVQWSFVNSVKSFKGVQLSFLWNNAKEESKGIQIGLINICKNGFLPVFPLINFAFK